MSLLKQIGYYLAGFSVGLIVLSIFLKKKNATFCYGIDCRILKNIRSKNIVFSSQASEMASNYKLDSLAVAYLLTESDVNISKSNTKLDSCKTYYIEGELNDKSIDLFVENCDKTATIQTITINP